MSSGFSHLHCHTEYSALDGFGSVQAWCRAVRDGGMSAIAITEHGNIDSAIKMSQECRANGIKFIAGCELYIAEDMRRKSPQSENMHICAFVRNGAGWKNLLMMLSEANIYGYHYKPRIDGKCLLSHLDGLAIGTACVASFATTQWGMELLGELAKKIPKNLFCEVMPHAIEGQVEWNKKILKMAHHYGLPIIATNDCHYPRPEDAELQDVCLAINSGSKLNEPGRFKFGANTFYCATPREMASLFQEGQPWMGKSEIIHYMRNTSILVEQCEDFNLPKVEVDLPLAPIARDVALGEEEENRFFQTLINKGLKERKNQLCRPLSEYRKRIREELDVLLPKKFVRYFLIVIDILRFCREKGIAVGPGRGSVGGCLVAWLTGITQVDPLRYNLLFARFQDPERSDLPDIDCDFEMDRRDEVLAYIKAIYGEQNVAQITTFLRMKGRLAMQDVARVMSIPREEVNEATKFLGDDDHISRETLLSNNEPAVIQYCKRHPEAVDVAIRLQGTVRGYGKHAAGICISRHSLSSGINGNLARRQGMLVSNWDKDEGEYMGLMKLDVLGLTALSRIRVCREMIAENHGVDIDLEAIDVEDKKALKLIAGGDCIGVFQLGTRGLMQYCKDLKISSFKDIYNATALYRPGTLSSGMAKEFLDRRHGKKWKYQHPSMKSFTQDTEGIIVYQEQAMLMFKELAGFTWSECNQVRKVIAKSKGEEALNQFKEHFLAGCLEVSGLDSGAALEIWQTIVGFSSYAFNLSHSVEYSIISMWDAWLKSHYRGEFYASCLSYLDEAKRTEMLAEAVACGMRVLLPVFSKSHSRLWKYVPENKTLLMPFAEIIGVGEKAAEQIYELGKQKKCKTFFGYKVDFSQIPASLRQMLTRIHAFEDNWKPTRRDAKQLRDLFKYNLNEILDL